MALLLRFLGVAACLLAAGAVRAEAPLRVDGELGEVPLSGHVAVLEDESAALSVEDLTRPDVAARFVTPRTQRETSYGYRDAVFWVRIPVQNRGAQAERWLLELAHPHLDEVTLFSAEPGGPLRAHATGDRVPFSTRDVAYASFVFARSEPAHSARTYYLRVRSAGVLNLPLTAWSYRAFYAHQQTEWLAYCLFYGAILFMMVSRLSVYVLSRQREAGVYCLYLAATFLSVFALAGHAQQFLFPMRPLLAERLLPMVVLLPFVLGLQVVRAEIRGLDLPGRGVIAPLLACAALVCLVTPFVSYRAGVFISHAAMVVIVLVAFGFGGLAARTGNREAKLLVTAFAFPVAGGLVYVLHQYGMIDAERSAAWSIPVGVAIQVVVISTTLGDRITRARDELHVVHVELQAKVEAVSEALVVARDAMRTAERDTNLRDQFIGTMSHEFLTPLNAIINIPEGIARHFEGKSVVSCGACRGLFELEPGEHLDATCACPDCQAAGCLVHEEHLTYTGDAHVMRHLLVRLERAGVGLLRTVNGILDFSKLQAGQFRVVREPLALSDALRSVAASFAAQHPGRTLHMESVDGALVLDVDAHCVADVLGHLLHNAVKFSAEGSPITLRARRVGETCEFAVRDVGIGIAPEDTARIFESFEQVSNGVRRAYGGTGLGLSVCRSLVEAHGGRIRVDSALGEGATFFFGMPLRAEQAEPVPRSA